VHATTITPEELGLLSRWIDIGAPGGPQELTDTQKPTLTLAALYEGASVTALRVGTVDIPSGIDSASLVVCIVDDAGACATMLAQGGALPHDVLEIPVALDDPEVEVLARVRDIAGNETELRRTVRWLLDSPLPPDPAGTETGADESGSGSASSGDASAGSVTSAGSEGTSGGGAASDDGGGGCGCTTSSPSASWLVLLLAGLRRRRLRLDERRA